MTTLRIKLVFGCLNCDKPIPLRIATKGRHLCSERCRREINKLGGQFTKEEVWWRNP